MTDTSQTVSQTAVRVPTQKRCELVVRTLKDTTPISALVPGYYLFWKPQR